MSFHTYVSCTNYILYFLKNSCSTESDTYLICNIISVHHSVCMALYSYRFQIYAD